MDKFLYIANAPYFSIVRMSFYSFLFKSDSDSISIPVGRRVLRWILIFALGPYSSLKTIEAGSNAIPAGATS